MQKNPCETKKLRRDGKRSLTKGHSETDEKEDTTAVLKVGRTFG